MYTYIIGTGKTGKSGFRIPDGPNVPDSPDFLIKLHKPARIPDRIFPKRVPIDIYISIYYTYYI
jgi:hypothetical protein